MSESVAPLPAYTRETACTPEMVRVALQISPRQWARSRHVLPWCYAFGDKSARIAWGTVLDFMAAKPSALRKSA